MAFVQRELRARQPLDVGRQPVRVAAVAHARRGHAEQRAAQPQPQVPVLGDEVRRAEAAGVLERARRIAVHDVGIGLCA